MTWTMTSALCSASSSLNGPAQTKPQPEIEPGLRVVTSCGELFLFGRDRNPYRLTAVAGETGKHRLDQVGHQIGQLV